MKSAGVLFPPSAEAGSEMAALISSARLRRCTAGSASHCPSLGEQLAGTEARAEGWQPRASLTTHPRKTHPRRPLIHRGCARRRRRERAQQRTEAYPGAGPGAGLGRAWGGAWGGASGGAGGGAAGEVVFVTVPTTRVLGH